MAIQYQTQEYPDEEILENLHPFVREWFTQTFPGFSPPQKFAIRNIQLGINSLISSPTGSGKTLSAFLAIINELVRDADLGTLKQEVRCIYISPLKALANDIDRNLRAPLDAITKIAQRYGRELDIRVGTRTGDTTKNDKAKMRARPPHILITTPESLAIMLTSSKLSESIHPARYLIVDEIHALAENKRGTHLSLSIERLNRYANFTRIGLSATVAPLEDVALFLSGMTGDGPRECKIIDVSRIGDGYTKRLDLQVISPVQDMMRATHADMQRSMYEVLNDLIQTHRSTLIFTNTRSATERVVHQLKARYPQLYANVLDADEEEEKLEEEEKPIEEQTPEEILRKDFIGAHHGSLSKAHRLKIEDMLKAGELRCVVCSTSLELGIDIGYIDLVILLGSPKSVARALQRIGRSGHKLHAQAKGRIIVLDRDDLVECSLLLKAALDKKIDRVHIPRNALDVLAQQLYGLAIERVTGIEEAWQLIRGAAPYRDLPREDFEKTLAYLAGEHTQLEERSIYAKIWIDREQGVFGKRGKLARLVYMTNVGTIPDETAVKVKIGETTIGTITEDFSERLKPGDVFVLGGEPYEFRFSRGTTVQVRTSGGKLPTVPNWISEMLPLNYDLAMEIQKFRRYVAGMLAQGKEKEEVIAWMREYLHNDEASLLAIWNYLREQHRFSVIAHDKRIVLEHFKDGNKRYVFVHTLFGRRVNDVLSRAMAYANARITNRDVEIGINDNGFYLKSTQPIQAKRALAALKPEDIEKLMGIALDSSEVLKRRFRHCATRGLMILRQYKGQSKSVGRQQISSQIILSAVRRVDQDFPILKEARREILEDLMDIEHAKEILERIVKGDIAVDERETQIPSPFAFTLILQSYVDLLKIDDRVEFVKRLHAMVLERIGERHAQTREGPLLPKQDFSYERLWEKQREEERLKQEDYAAYLRHLAFKATRKEKLPPDHLIQINRMIDGERPAAWFDEWLDQLLQGTIPKHWEDDLVKFFRERKS